MKNIFKINNKIVKKPIIQGGMGIKISMSSLASAVMKEDVVATISVAQPAYVQKADSEHKDFRRENIEKNKKAITEEITKARKDNKDGILGVNLMTALEGFEEIAEYLSTQDIDFVISGAGLPMELPKFFKDSKVKPAMIVSNARTAKILCKNWIRKFDTLPEFIVVEGPLAGGHLGFTKEQMRTGDYQDLEDILPEVIEIVKPFEEKYGKSIPIVPAGGIHTSEDVKTMLDLGASAVQIATRFIATHECDCHINYKQSLVDATESDIVEVPSPVGMPGRAIKNYFTELLKKGNIPIASCVNCLRVCAKRDIPYCITEKLGNASVYGDTNNSLVFTGANAFKIKSIVSVKELVQELMMSLKGNINYGT